MGIIEQRASVRQYTDEPVSDEEVREILRAAMAAPSAGNQQPWEFYVVRDPELRVQLAEASPYAKPCGRAPLTLVFCVREEGLRFPEYAVQDLSACIENAWLKLTELGLGAVWMGIEPLRDRMDSVRATLGLPDGLRCFALLAVGRPEQAAEPKGPSRFDEGRIHWC